MRVLVAPTAFKGTASPVEAARAIAEGWRAARPDDRVTLLPMADGGDGTAEVLKARLGGRWINRTVRGPLGRPVRARGLITKDGVAVVEMARTSGLVLDDERDPMRADTRGTGEMIRECLDAGAETVYLGLGGSATTDGGAGAAHALGARLLSGRGEELEPSPSSFALVRSVDLAGLDPRASRVVALNDVMNPLLGPLGAANVFAPQKGATPEDVHLLERGLSRLVAVTSSRKFAAMPGAGAAGGFGWGVLALLGGTLDAGGTRIASLVGLAARVGRADLVLTGEGRLDTTTLGGKAPSIVAKHARMAEVPCMAVVGSNALTASQRRDGGFDLVVPLEGRTIADATSALAASL